ncbi:MAG: glycosyltransferase family 4 protein [Bacteroidota bacterium]
MAQRKPTVLFLAAWYPTPNNKSHGIFIRNHAMALSRFCHVIVVYAYSHHQATVFSKTRVNDNFEEWMLAYKKTTTSVTLLSTLIKYIDFKKAYRLLARELMLAKTDITSIIVNTVYPTAIALPLFKTQWPVPYSIIEHWTGYLPEDGNYRGPLMKYYTGKTIAGANNTFCVSQKQIQAMQEHGLNGHYKLIYNVVDTAVFKPVGHNSSQKPLLISVSSLDERQKNITGLLNVIGALQKKGDDFDFVFIGGTAALAEHYRLRAAKLNLKNVLFAGSKTPAEIAAYMQKAKAFVLFSNYENMPVVVLEALACGLPVFSSDTGCLNTIVKPEFGRLVEIGDESALAENLSALLRGQLNFNSAEMSAHIHSVASYGVVGKQLYDHSSALPES